MSGVSQRSKGLKRKIVFCGNGSRFNSRAEAKEYIEKLIKKNQRGAKTLIDYPCKVCDTIHVGHRHRRPKQ
jgi:hypothetical protein